MAKIHPEHLNKQNKRNARLNKNENPLNQMDCVNWFEICVLSRSDKMNKRLNRISPRRSKKSIEEVIQEIESSDDAGMLLEEMAEIFEEMSD